MRGIRKTEIILAGLVLLSFIISLSFYTYLPQQIPTNWGYNGTVAFGYLPRFQGAFLMPLSNLVVLLIPRILSRIKPSLEKKKRFAQYYDKFFIILVCWYICFQLIMLLWSIDVKINPTPIIITGFGALCFYFGIMFANAKQGWFIALPTQWTLSDKNIWEKVHKTGGMLVKIAGLVTVIMAFIPISSDELKVLKIAPIPLGIGGLIIYVYILGYFKYGKPKKQN